jgi:hypothetical protein
MTKDVFVPSNGMRVGDSLNIICTGRKQMTEQEEQLLKEDYKELEEEVEKCFDLAQRLDALNPELAGAFTGSPSQRIERQLYALGILNN